MKRLSPKHSTGAAALAPYSIGSKLKTLRTEKGLTLARLGAETQLSTALLSKLESGSMIPTLQTLAKICRVYGVDLSFFFAAPSQHSLAITRSAHISEERRGSQLEPREMPLHRATSGSRQVSKLVDLPLGVSWNVGNSGTRTELTAYVLEGALHLTIAGSTEVPQTGDCLVIDTDSALLWIAPHTHCRVLAEFVRTRPGDVDLDALPRNIRGLLCQVPELLLSCSCFGGNMKAYLYRLLFVCCLLVTSATIVAVCDAQTAVPRAPIGSSRLLATFYGVKCFPPLD